MATSAFIVDVGSHSVKVGASTAVAPTTVPSVCGTPRFPRVLCPDDVPVSCVGNDAMAQRALLRLRTPIQRGVVQDWSAAKGLLTQADGLAVAQYASNADESVLALVEHPFASRKQRQRLVEYYLEGGGSSDEDAVAGAVVRPRRRGVAHAEMPPRPWNGVFCGVAPLLALYATGATTGVVLEVGHQVVSTAAAVAGASIPGALQRHDGRATGGAAVTALFETLLRQSGGCVSGSSAVLGTGSVAEQQLLCEVKESVCCVASSPPPRAMLWSTPAEETVPAMDYTLPDGSTLEVGAVARSYAAEVLFDPSLVGEEGDGVITHVQDAIASAGPELVASLRQHIVLSGGGSLVAGFAQRCFHELQTRVPEGSPIRLVAPASRATAPWFGICVLSQLSTFTSGMIVTRSEYEESGEPALQARLFT